MSQKQSERDGRIMSTKGLMNQKQWIVHNESQDKVASLVKKISLLLLGVPVVVSVLLAVVLGQYVVLPLLGIVLGVALQRAVTSSSRSAFADVAELLPASDETYARVYNVVDGLCVVSGDQRPAVVLIDSSYPVAVAAVDAQGSNVIGVSQQFVNVMSRVEVEAVMAHLLWRLRVGHAQLVSYLAGLQRVLSKIGLGSLAQRAWAQALPLEMVTIADIAACQATRFPPAAVSALEKCESASGNVHVGLAEVMAFALPSDADDATTSGRKVSSLEISRPTLSERIAILKEM